MSFFEKIKAGLKKTKENTAANINAVFATFRTVDEELLSDLEDALILADIGAYTASEAIDELRKQSKLQNLQTKEEVIDCLEKILADGFDVVGVYTQPDRPKNRGMKLTASPVKVLAQAHDIPVFQPENFREDADVENLRALQPDVVAVVAYGRILPQRVLDIPAGGCINIHASLLPEYRGSAPYQWAVLDGRQETGVTAMYLVREMDAGDMIIELEGGMQVHRDEEE